MTPANIREVLANVLVLCGYVEEHAICPKNVDLEALRRKALSVRKMVNDAYNG